MLTPTHPLLKQENEASPYVNLNEADAFLTQLDKLVVAQLNEETSFADIIKQLRTFKINNVYIGNMATRLEAYVSTQIDEKALQEKISDPVVRATNKRHVMHTQFTALTEQYPQILMYAFMCEPTRLFSSKIYWVFSKGQFGEQWGENHVENFQTALFNESNLYSSRINRLKQLFKSFNILRKLGYYLNYSGTSKEVYQAFANLLNILFKQLEEAKSPVELELYRQYAQFLIVGNDYQIAIQTFDTAIKALTPTTNTQDLLQDMLTLAKARIKQAEENSSEPAPDEKLEKLIGRWNEIERWNEVVSAYNDAEKLYQTYRRLATKKGSQPREDLSWIDTALQGLTAPRRQAINSLKKAQEALLSPQEASKPSPDKNAKTLIAEEDERKKKKEEDKRKKKKTAENQKTPAPATTAGKQEDEQEAVHSPAPKAKPSRINALVRQGLKQRDESHFTEAFNSFQQACELSKEHTTLLSEQILAISNLLDFLNAQSTTLCKEISHINQLFLSHLPALQNNTAPYTVCDDIGTKASLHAKRIEEVLQSFEEEVTLGKQLVFLLEKAADPSSCFEAEQTELDREIEKISGIIKNIKTNRPLIIQARVQAENTLEARKTCLAEKRKREKEQRVSADSIVAFSKNAAKKPKKPPAAKPALNIDAKQLLSDITINPNTASTLADLSEKLQQLQAARLRQTFAEPIIAAFNKMKLTPEDKKALAKLDDIPESPDLQRPRSSSVQY